MIFFLLVIESQTTGILLIMKQMWKPILSYLVSSSQNIEYIEAQSKLVKCKYIFAVVQILVTFTYNNLKCTHTHFKK